MTAYEPAARAAEGWCPHPEHGPLYRLRLSGAAEYCEACAGFWRVPDWPCGPALLFICHTDAGRLTRVITLEEVAHGQPCAGDMIEAHVEQTHRDALAGRP